MKQFRESAVLLAFALLNIRSFIGAVSNIDTLILTFLINILLLGSIDYRKMGSSVLLVFCFIPLIAFNKGSLSFVNILLFVYLLKDVPIKNLAIVNFSLLLIEFLIITFFLELNILQNETWLQPKGFSYGFGFKNPNTFGEHAYYLLLNLYLLVKNKSPYFSPLLILGLFYIAYYYSQSRTFFIGGLILILVHYLLVFKLLWSSVRFLIAFFPLIIVSCVLYLSFNVYLFPEIDILASTRLSIYNGILSSMSLLNWLSGIALPEKPMDGSYLMLIFNGGVGAFILFYVNYFFSIIKCFKYLYPYMAVILSILVCGIGENTFSSTQSTSIIFWLLISTYFLRRVRTPLEAK